jgi:hypothetical protein
MIDVKELRLGTKISFDAEYIRVFKNYFAVQERTWISVKTPSQEGIVVGLRTIADGTVHYDMEEGNTFSPRSYKSCAIVATHIRRKFSKVPIENITIIK